MAVGRYIDLGNPVADHPLNQGLVGWWLSLPNNSGGTQLFDLSHTRAHGTLTNGTTWTSGAAQGLRSILHNGSNQYEDCGQPDSLKLTRTFTFAARVLLTGGGNYPAIFSRTNAWNETTAKYVMGFPSSTLRLEVNMGAVRQLSATGAISTNVWNYVAGASDTSGVDLYSTPAGGPLYTESAAAYAADANYASADDHNRIGCYVPTAGATNGFFPGRIESIRVWAGRKLSASEIALDYDLARRGYDGLLRTWDRRVYSFGPVAAPPAASPSYLTLLGVG